jgi:hypothetical protein
MAGLDGVGRKETKLTVRARASASEERESVEDGMRKTRSKMYFERTPWAR